jgi:hypothetical protein
MSKAVLGMPNGPLPEGFISIGCIADDDNPEWLCAECAEDDAWDIE